MLLMLTGWYRTEFDGKCTTSEMEDGINVNSGN